MASTAMTTAITNRGEAVVERLKAIASIKVGQYWCTYTTSPQENSYTTSLLRTIYYRKETRHLNVADIAEAVESAFRVLNDILDMCPSTPESCKKILLTYQTTINDIRATVLSSKDGIANLGVTYHDDTIISGKLDKIITNITTKKIEFDTKVKSLTEPA